MAKCALILCEVWFAVVVGYCMYAGWPLSGQIIGAVIGAGAALLGSLSLAIRTGVIK